MMSKSYHCRDDSLSESVFSEDESGFQDICSPGLSQDVFSPNLSMSSLRDIYSPRTQSRDVAYSPAMSNYSTYSQEVKYIFDPNFGSQQDMMTQSLSSVNLQSSSQYEYDKGLNINMQPVPKVKVPTPSAKYNADFDRSGNSTEDDYSQIQYSDKNPSVQRRLSNTSQYSYNSQGQNSATHGFINTYSKNGVKYGSQGVHPPPPPPRTSSSTSSAHITQQGDATLTKQPKNSSLMHSMSASYTYNYPYQQTRRKTWSPEALGHLQGLHTTAIKRDHRLRSVSNEELLETNVEKQRDHIYEELESGPPKLTPISGMLNKTPGRGIIRPIAFKPVMTNQKFATPPKQYGDHPRKYSSHDDGYGSQDYGGTNQNPANISHGSTGSSHMECDRSASFSSDCNRASDRSDSVPATHLTRLSTNPMDGYVQTPSPSDSGVGELEAILKEKDAEINTLRDVMDKNERAIFQVYEDKKSGWVREIHEVREEYENKLKIMQRKSYKTEQVLNLQLYKLQQDKKAMKEETEKILFEKDELTQKCEVYADETNRLQAQMDDATWQGRRPPPSGDFTNLQQQVDNLQNKLTNKSEEVLRLQSMLDKAKSKLVDEANSNTDILNKNKQISERLKPSKLSTGSITRFNSSGSDLEPDIPLCQCEKEIQTDFAKAMTPERETLKPSIICEKDRELTSLREDLDKLSLEMLVNKEEYEKEKEQWLEEKNKVIMYQKQLQLNYVQMFRKNKVLEAEVEQLTMELESRDMKLMALNGEESVC